MNLGKNTVWWLLSSSTPEYHRCRCSNIKWTSCILSLCYKTVLWYCQINQFVIWKHHMLLIFLRWRGLDRHFYPRPVLAFGYCRCLRVCVCVRVSVNHELVRAINHQPCKLGSPNLDQRCKRPWLRSLLFCGVIDGDLQGQFELESQNLPHFGLMSLSGR